MPLTGAIPEGPSFFCPHCGALYAVTYSRLSDSDSNAARCVVCGQIMDKWDWPRRYLPSSSFIDLKITDLATLRRGSSGRMLEPFACTVLGLTPTPSAIFRAPIVQPALSERRGSVLQVRTGAEAGQASYLHPWLSAGGPGHVPGSSRAQTRRRHSSSGRAPCRLASWCRCPAS